MKFWGIHLASPAPRSTSSRHEFVIGPLHDNPFFGKKARLYYCMRCTWRFLVSGSEVVVLDGEGHPTKGADSSSRFATFAEGPCPALAGLKAERPIKAYIVHLNSARKNDESRTVVASNLPAWSSGSRPLFRIFDRVRENLRRQA